MFSVTPKVYISVFDKIFNLHQIGSGQALAEPMYFLTGATTFNIGNTIILFSAKIQYCVNSIGPCYFTVAPMWLTSYHDTGLQGTFWHHLVCHRTLSKTLVYMHSCVQYDKKYHVVQHFITRYVIMVTKVLNVNLLSKS